jgi:hypothetical protein
MAYSSGVEPSDVGSEPVVVLLTVITIPINYCAHWGWHVSELPAYVV